MAKLSFHFIVQKSPEVVSPYFSPIKTRNQRKHIKIQTEETLTQKPLSKITAKAVIKQATIDAIEAFASTSKLKPKNKLETVSAKKKISDFADTADTKIQQEKVDSIKTKSPKSKAKQKVKFETEEIKTETIETVPVEDKSVVVDTEWQPKNWKQMIENIREMRKTRSAPVDTMGCHKCSDETASEKVIFANSFEIDFNTRSINK